MTYCLEQKVLYIVQEPLRKNRTHQTYRWQQIALCEEKQPLQDYIDKQDFPNNFRIDKVCASIEELKPNAGQS